MPFPKSSLTRASRQAVTIFVNPGPCPDLMCPPGVCSLDCPPPVQQLLLFFMDPSNEGANPFSSETWSSFLVHGRREVEVTFVHEGTEVEVTAPAGRRGSGTASLPLAEGFSPSGTLAMQNGHQIQPMPYNLWVSLGL